jgi:hypothetical protein
VLRQLDQRRSTAFAQSDRSALDHVYVRGSAPHRNDQAALAELASRGLTADGLRLQIRSAVVTARARDHVVLRVVDRLAPYDLVDGTERPVGHRPGRGDRAWVVMLVPATGGDWRIAAVTPAAG